MRWCFLTAILLATAFADSQKRSNGPPDQIYDNYGIPMRRNSAPNQLVDADGIPMRRNSAPDRLYSPEGVEYKRHQRQLEMVRLLRRLHDLSSPTSPLPRTTGQWSPSGSPPTKPHRMRTTPLPTTTESIQDDLLSLAGKSEQQHGYKRQKASHSDGIYKRLLSILLESYLQK